MKRETRIQLEASDIIKKVLEVGFFFGSEGVFDAIITGAAMGRAAMTGETPAQVLAAHVAEPKVTDENWEDDGAREFAEGFLEFVKEALADPDCPFTVQTIDVDKDGNPVEPLDPAWEADDDAITKWMAGDDGGHG